MAYAFNEMQNREVGNGQNHSLSRESEVDWEEWEFVAQVSPDGWAEIDAGQEILLEFRSDATPPTEQWYAEVNVSPLDTDGTIQDVHATPDWFEPRRHTVITGEMVPQRFRADALIPNEGGYRWHIRIPPQAPTHGNSSWRAINVYRRVPPGG